MIFTLDTATTTGYAFGPAGARASMLAWGSRTFGYSGCSNGEILATFRQWFNQRCYDLKPTIVCFESPYIPVARVRFSKKGLTGGPPPMNPLVLRRLLGMTGIIEAVCWELRIRCYEATTGETCKYLTGKSRHGGRPEKKAAVVDACRYFGWDVNNDDDAADALALWAFAESIFDPTAALQRRRVAADRDRDLHGAGPLFQPEKQNAPRCQSRGVQELADSEVSPCPTNARVM